MQKTLLTCTQRPCQAICLDFNDTGVKLKGWTGCTGELSAGSSDETMTWTISPDKKTLTLIKSGKGTEYIIVKLTSMDLVLKKK